MKALQTPSYPCQVVELKDLPHYLLFRAFNMGCNELRHAQWRFHHANQIHEAAEDRACIAAEKYGTTNKKRIAARLALEAADEVLEAETAEFLAHKRPPFYQLRHA